jgi:hypothetical protein
MWRLHSRVQDHHRLLSDRCAACCTLLQAYLALFHVDVGQDALVSDVTLADQAHPCPGLRYGGRHDCHPWLGGCDTFLWLSVAHRTGVKTRMVRVVGFHGDCMRMQSVIHPAPTLHSMRGLGEVPALRL